VVDHDVHRPESRQRRGYNRLRTLGRVRLVAAGDRRATPVLDLVHHLRRRASIGIVDHDPRAPLGQLDRDPLAQPAHGSGDDDHASVEAEVAQWPDLEFATFPFARSTIGAAGTPTPLLVHF
jgi:hypothetical protein